MQSARPGCACPGRTKDDLAVLIGGVSAKSYSSQGQTRTAALSIKLAEREIYKNTVGEYPVLLLDDVLSELDAGGRNSCSTAFRADRCSSPAAKTTGWERCSKERCFTLQTARLCDGKGVAAKCMFPLGRARWCAAVISWAYLIWTTPPGPTAHAKAWLYAEREGRVIAVGDDLPRAPFIVLRAEQIWQAGENGARVRAVVYLTQLLCRRWSKRFQSERI